MKRKLQWINIPIILFVLWNCGPTYPDDTTDNTTYPIPEFSNEQLAYHSGRQQLHCEVMVLYDSLINSVLADIQLQGFEENTLSIALNDSGLYGDALPDDDVYSRNIYLNHIDSMEGIITIEYTAQGAGSLIQTFFDTLFVIANLPPYITEIVMPDTIVRPRTGTKDLFIYVTVDDPNGVHDVTNGYFQVKNNTSGLWGVDYNLNDNGELGDTEAGDGIFSTGLEISANNAVATNYFRFRVKDSASNFSDWSLDSVVVR